MLMIRNYISLTPGSAEGAVEILSQCLEILRVWMGGNRLQLNSSEMKLLFVHYGPQLAPVAFLKGVALPCVSKGVTGGSSWTDSYCWR